MQTLFSELVVTYTGPQLRSGWLAETFGVGDDALVAWLGPCHVATADLVDLEDQRAGAEIHAALMLHFLAEHPGRDLPLMVLRQRLLVAEALEILHELGAPVRREGDDLYLCTPSPGKGEGAGGGVLARKLSVSIATLSPRSGLIHFALNVDPTGAPVPAVGLAELGVDPRAFAERLLERYATELASAMAACEKVRGTP